MLVGTHVELDERVVIRLLPQALPVGVGELAKRAEAAARRGCEGIEFVVRFSPVDQDQGVRKGPRVFLATVVELFPLSFIEEAQLLARWRNESLPTGPMIVSTGRLASIA